MKDVVDQTETEIVMLPKSSHAAILKELAQLRADLAREKERAEKHYTLAGNWLLAYEDALRQVAEEKKKVECNEKLYVSAVDGRAQMRDGLRIQKDRAEKAESQLAEMRKRTEECSKCREIK